VLALCLVVALLLAVFLPPLINLGHYRRSITASISAAVGRPVSVGDMQLRLLPTPGIAMTDFTVAEDPAFGFEPALHANSMVASLRLGSLWRGRLEVSRISLDEASVNLVKNGAGHWSIGSILLRASQIQNAATGERRAGEHPRFPYIEATSARIDFKDGVEKRPFSLMNAKFAMWQASGGEWRLRLKAQPVRTDLQLHLSDTGELTVQGSLRKAAELGAMPVNLQAEWSGAQLGQVSRLLAGIDSGWRGDLDVTGTVSGNAADLELKTRIRIANLRRQEFQPVTAANIDATCQSEYQHAQRLLGQITCFLPAGQGHLLLTGKVQGGPTSQAALSLEMNQMPAQFPLTLLGLLRPHAGNVTATGTMNGNLQWASAEQTTLSGDATANSVTLNFPGQSLALPALHFVTEEPTPPRKNKRSARLQPLSAPTPPGIALEPIAIPFGDSESLTVGAQMTAAGFTLRLTGAAAVSRILTVGANLGVLGNALGAVTPKGHANLTTTTTGPWVSSAPGGSGLSTTGTVRLQGAEIRLGFLHAPVEVASADVQLTPQTISWEDAVVSFQGIAAHASVAFADECNQATPCPVTFTLQPREMTAAEMEAALAGQRPGFFGQMLSDLGNAQGVAWPPLHGTVEWSTLHLGKLALRNVVATVDVRGRAMTLDSLDAQSLGGTTHATGDLAMADGMPRWNLDMRLTGIKANEAAGLFREPWGAGAGSAEAKLILSGWRASDLASSAAGSFQLTWQNGGLPAAGPLAHFSHLTAGGTIANEILTLNSGRVIGPGGSTAISGTLAFDRHVNLRLKSPKATMNLSGTLAHPVITSH
jgi:hypothetical protein